MMLDIKATEEGCVMSVRAQPGARRDAIVGLHAGALKVAVTAPPDKGRANEAIVEVLAEALKIPKSSLNIVSGQTSRQKKLAIGRLTPEEVQTRLAGIIDEKS